MRDNTSGIDFRSIAESIGQALRSAGEAVAESATPATVWTESGLRRAILRAVRGEPKTGHEIIVAIEATNEWGIKPAASRVYPLLESLVDEQLLTVSVVKDRKRYALTASGTAAADADSGDEHDTTSAREHLEGAWASLRSELTTASSRLAKTAFDVARHGTPEQQRAAAQAIDDARRAIHAIMAAS